MYNKLLAEISLVFHILFSFICENDALQLSGEHFSRRQIMKRRVGNDTTVQDLHWVISVLLGYDS